MAHASCDQNAVYEELESIFTNLRGTAWKRRGNWTDRSVPVCEWEGIACKTGNVTQVVLPQNNLDGEISAIKLPCISETIISLDLYGNEGLTGNLPAAWGGMRQLQRYVAAVREGSNQAPD